MNVTQTISPDNSGLQVASLAAPLAAGDLVSEEVYKAVRSISAGTVTFLLSLLGIPLNVLNCLVFARQGLRDRMNLCLFSLALVDTVLLVVALVHSSASIAADVRLLENSEEHYFIIVKYGFGIIYASRTTAGCYHMIIAVERCVCVLLPLRASSFLRTRTMGVILAAFALLLQAGFVILPLRFELVRIETKGPVQWRLGPSKLLLNNQFVLDLVFYTILNASVPLVTCIIVSMATFLTVVKLKLAMSLRKKLSTSCADVQRNQTALTKVLVAVSCAYIASMLPFVTYVCAQLAVPAFSPYGRYANLFLTCNGIVSIFPFINCCLTFFIYYNRSTRFRADLKSICCFRKKSYTKSQRA